MDSRHRREDHTADALEPCRHYPHHAMTRPGEDFLAAPSLLLLEEALRTVHVLASTPGTSVDDIREVSELALSRDRFRKGIRAGRPSWLARVTSFAFPRTFSTGPLIGRDTAETVTLLDRARKHHHVCFTAEIGQDARKDAAGRQVEIQIPAQDAIRLGQQMVRIAQSFGAPQTPARRTAASAGRQAPPSSGDEMT